MCSTIGTVAVEAPLNFVADNRKSYKAEGKSLRLCFCKCPRGAPQTGAPRALLSDFCIKKGARPKSRAPRHSNFRSDDVRLVARRLIELLLLLLITGLAEERERRLLARFDAGLVEGVDVEHRARISGLQLE